MIRDERFVAAKTPALGPPSVIGDDALEQQLDTPRGAWLRARCVDEVVAIARAWGKH